MNLLTSGTPIDSLLGAKFCSFIKTDIELKNGNHSQMVTLLSDNNMFDEVFMGISQALRSGGKASKWQSQLFYFVDGELKASCKTAIITPCK